MNRDKIIEAVAKAIQKANCNNLNIADDGTWKYYIPLAENALNASGLLEQVQELEKLKDAVRRYLTAKQGIAELTNNTRAK